MFVLTFDQEGRTTDVGIFETMEEGRSFLSGIPAYGSYEEDGVLYEYLEWEKLPIYHDIHFRGHIVPLTKFMFESTKRIEIYWKELPLLSQKGTGMVDGATRVDAYVIDNRDVKDYIEEREKKYMCAREKLEKKGYEVTRAFFGSEDGEAIMIRKKGREEWRFLIHMDPVFVESGEEKTYLDEIENL